MIKMQLGQTTTGYVPNCSGTYNPCTELSKGRAQGYADADMASLIANCGTYNTSCGTTTSTTPWYTNPTYLLIGGAVLVGGWLLLK
jgi:hypothetical protein